MTKFWNSAAFRLSLICGSLVVISVFLFSTAFYMRTVGVLEHNADEKIILISDRLFKTAETEGITQAASKISQALTDGVDSDTEIYLLSDANGKKMAGNIQNLKMLPIPDRAGSKKTDENVDTLSNLHPVNQIIDQRVTRDGRPSQGRLIVRRTSNGNYLVVGRDMSDLNEIKVLIWKAIGIGSLLALNLSVVGTIFFRSQIESKIWAIRHAAQEIETGDLKRRIEVSEDGDEFSKLSRDLNRMLDRIEHLMDSIRHVSNNIAHNLRTPLGRIRGHLDEALRTTPDIAKLKGASEFAIHEVDELISLLGKLMQIAEAESEIRRQHFKPVSICELLTNLVELYDAAAEEMDVKLHLDMTDDPMIVGDKELISCAISNLLDNSLKYAGPAATIVLHASYQVDHVTLQVRDNGPGIAEQDRAKALQRFHRLNYALPGHGMGLPIVNAIIKLHGGNLCLEDARPGLAVCITIPKAEPVKKALTT